MNVKLAITGLLIYTLAVLSGAYGISVIVYDSRAAEWSPGPIGSQGQMGLPGPQGLQGPLGHKAYRVLQGHKVRKAPPSDRILKR